MRKILSLILLCSPCLVIAQHHDVSSETITWVSSKTILSDTVYNVESSIVSNPSEGKISVIKNGREKFFTILRTEGVWTNTSVIGKIIFYVKFVEEDAVISFERTPDQVLATITIGSQATRKIIIDQIITP